VISVRLRGAILTGALAIASLLLPGSAQALTPESQITTPSSFSFPVGEESSMLTIAGTAKFPEAEIRCYSSAEEFHILKSKVPVVSEKFSTEVLVGALGQAPCQLRAVPEGETGPFPPGEVEPFEGPFVSASFYTHKEATNFFVSSGAFPESFRAEDVGQYGLESDVYSAPRHESLSFFYGVGGLQFEAPSATRASLQVDGANSYAPLAVQLLENEGYIETATPGVPSVTEHVKFEASHAVRIQEEDPIVKCEPENANPPTKTSCTSLVSTGVTLDREWLTTNEDRVAQMTDTWRSTDGAAHSVNARYYTEMNNSIESGSYEFPGEGSFKPTKTGEAKSLPSGPNMILYKWKSSTPDGGDGEYPQGAIVYDSSPSEAIAVTKGSESPGFNVMEMPYQRTLPAGGSSVLRMAFVQGFNLPEIRSLAEPVLAGYPPSIAITSPANGAVVNTPSVTVTGTASDGGALESLTVNGHAVAVANSWSTTVPLSVGANTITATATDDAGIKKSAAVTVTYTPLPPPPPVAKASKVGAVSGAKGQIKLTLACKGTAGTSCLVQVTATTTERIRNGKVIATVARHRIHSKRVTVGTVTVRIAAGKTKIVTITLDRTGRKLLARFHKLPIALSAVLIETGNKKVKIFSQTLTVKPPKKKHKH
jgi:Glucodextranase, domain B